MEVNKRIIDNINRKICCISKKQESLDEVIFFSNIGTNDLLSLAVPGLPGKLYIDIDTGESFIANHTGMAPYYLKVSDGTLDAMTIEFMSGLLTTTIYAPVNMKINSITNVLNSPTTTIAKNGSTYTLGDSIAMGDALTITVSIASVIKLNIQYV